MTDNKRLEELSAHLRNNAEQLEKTTVVAGFDGFVDEMISVVQERAGLDEWTPVKDITTFGALIQQAAGHSSLREIVVHKTDPGGCAVNLGDGLLGLGLGLDCFATLGTPRHAAFDEFAGRCRNCVSWGKEHGRTLAFEFSDGKLMFSAVTQLSEFNTSLLDETLSDNMYKQSCSEAPVIALTDWTLYPHMTDCWYKLQEEIYSSLTHKPYFFIDLVDPSSRAIADIRRMTEALPGFEKSGVTVLGLNGTEANVLARALSIPETTEEHEPLKAQANTLRSKLGISQVVIHGIKMAAAATEEETFCVDGPFCPNPKKSTGAGDRFNAGYIAGLILGLDTENRLLLGNASSGFFVRNAKSANTSELSEFMDAWREDRID
ncbi:MAG: carbohydrate kinase family protein [Verrucomicrobia bacterium]|nr:carbohydrate kinase family protein [Verrucomicrobiota bacterium]